MNHTTASPSRRRFLLGAAGTAASAVAGGSLVGCSTGGGPEKTEPGNTTSTLPNHIPYEGIEPDLPGTEDGVMAAYLNYPAEPPQAVSDTPASGGEMWAFTQVLADQLNNPERNRHWQALNDALGLTVKVTGANGPEFDAKVQTMIAGDDLPDLLQVTSFPRLPDVLAAKFADLSEHLSGDKIKDYPMLGAIATDSWRTTAYNGGIYGVPASRGGVPSNLIIRRDVFDELGVNPEFENADDLLKAAHDLTDKNAKRFAFGTEPAAFLVPMVSQMLDVPNGWAVNDGAFTSAIEHPGTKQAIEYVTGMWADELIHPASITNPTQNSGWFRSRATAMITGSLASWLVYVQSATAEGLPTSVIDGAILPKFDGGGVASYWKGRRAYSFTALKQAEPERIRTLLSALNWLASPFGTQEYLLKNFGVAGTNYQLDDGNPVPIVGSEEYMYFLNYIVTSNEVLYQPGRADVVRRQHELQTKIIPTSLPIPTEGLYSETQLSKGANLDRDIQFAQNDIIAGRKPLSSWDDAVAAWKSGGGDTIAKEYAEAYAAS